MRNHFTICLILFFTSGLILLLGFPVGSNDVVYQLLQVDKEFDHYLQANEEEIIIRALDLLQQLLEKDADNVEVLWRLGKTYHFLGIHRGNDIATWEQGRIYLAKAAEQQVEVAHVYFWLAAITGQIGQQQGVLNSLFMLQPMRENLEKAIEIDPLYGEAYYGLGRLYFQAPGWPISFGDKNKALMYMREAVRINPEDLEFQRGLLNVLEKLGYHEEAREVLGVIKALGDN